MLSKKSVNEYIALLSSDAPAPGGGSAAALCGAQGAGLCAMAAALTLGKKKYAEFEQHCLSVYQKADALSRRMVELMNQDAAAYDKFSAAYKLPKETDEEKTARKAAIAKASLDATLVPLDMMKAALDALELTKSLVNRSNPNLATDVGAAALNLKSCARGAWLNILINLPSISEKAEAERIRREGESLLNDCEALSDEIYSTILAQTKEKCDA